MLASGDHWTRYYAEQADERLPAPSQFAVFVHGEYADSDLIVDVGCGNGRDSLFFAQQGHAVIGIDSASTAIERCQAMIPRNGAGPIAFLCGSIEDEQLHRQMIAKADAAARPLVYARFFLHAIDEIAEAAFFRFAYHACGSKGAVALEFRTTRDAAQSKVTSEHYRRFLDPLSLVARAQKAGFSSDYFVEGFGLAKYKTDDAHVARFLMNRA